MARYFLVTVVKSDDAEKFKVEKNLDLVGWKTVATDDTTTELEIVEAMHKEGWAVIGIESDDLLQRKLKMLDDFKLQFGIEITQKEKSGNL